MIAGIPCFIYKKSRILFTNNLSESKSEHAGDMRLSRVASSPTTPLAVFLAVYTTMLNLGMCTNLDVWA